MADTPDAPDTDNTADTPTNDAQRHQGQPKKARSHRSTEDRARARYGTTHGLTGKALDERWSAIPDGLREAYRHQVR